MSIILVYIDDPEKQEVDKYGNTFYTCQRFNNTKQGEVRALDYAMNTAARNPGISVHVSYTAKIFSSPRTTPIISEVNTKGEIVG